MPKAQLFFTPLNHTLETEFLGEEEKDSFIALPGKGRHRGLMSPKPRIPAWGRSPEKDDDLILIMLTTFQ